LEAFGLLLFLCGRLHSTAGVNGLPTRFPFGLDLAAIFFLAIRASSLNKSVDHYLFFFFLFFFSSGGHGSEDNGENGFATRFPFGLDLAAIFFVGMANLLFNKRFHRSPAAR
jgi:hypothetical protein